MRVINRAGIKGDEVIGTFIAFACSLALIGYTAPDCLSTQIGCYNSPVILLWVINIFQVLLPLAAVAYLIHLAMKYLRGDPSE